MKRLTAFCLILILSAVHFGPIPANSGLDAFVGVAGSDYSATGMWYALTGDGQIYRRYTNPGGVGWHYFNALPGANAPYVGIATRHNNENGFYQFMIMSGDGHSYWEENGQGWTPLEPIDLGGVPGRFITIGGCDAGPYQFIAIMDSGRWWYFDDQGVGWHDGGMIGAHTTSIEPPAGGVKPATWGQVKAGQR